MDTDLVKPIKTIKYYNEMNYFCFSFFIINFSDQQWSGRMSVGLPPTSARPRRSTVELAPRMTLNCIGYAHNLQVRK